MKKMLSCLLAFALLLMVTPIASLNVSATTEFAGGSGTRVDPYLISTKEHLNNIHYHLGAYYKMIGDIVFTDADFEEGGSFYNNQSGWAPIGSSSSPFTGVLDGNGYSIKGLYSYFKWSPAIYRGLFGWNSGTIQNVTMVDCNIIAISSDIQIGGGYAGAIAAVNKGTIEWCSASGTVFASTNAGGLVGKNYTSGKINKSHNDCIVTSDDTMGGISGYNDGSVADCFNVGKIKSAKEGTSSGTAGGVVGEGWYPSRSYNLGEVSGHYAGGVIGWFPDSYSTGNTGSSCYYVDTAETGAGHAKEDSCVKLTIDEMKNATSFPRLDFEKIWKIDTTGEYPFPTLQDKVADSSYFAGGQGTADDPFLIATQSQLVSIKNYAEFYFKLIDDITITYDDDYPYGWTPIYKFEGVFDGNGHTIFDIPIKPFSFTIGRQPGLFTTNNGTIKNLIIENMQIDIGIHGDKYGGFVAAENNGLIENCVTKNSSIVLGTGYHYFGGIVGNNTGTIRNCTSNNCIDWTSVGGRAGGIASRNSGVIENCTNNTTITNVGAYSPVSGGIAAQNTGTIRLCKNCADIHAKSTASQKNARAGGIVGEMSAGEIKQCYNKGAITVEATSYKGNTYSGGIVAYISSGTISDCYSFADTYGESVAYSYVGGVVGYNTTTQVIKNCYAIGTHSGRVSSSNLYVGYICGYNSTNTLENCYYLGLADNGSGYGDVSSQYGNNVSILKLQSTYEQFDFDTIWTMSGNQYYPFPELNMLPMEYEKEIVSVCIETFPMKLTYTQHRDSLDVSGGTIKVTYKYDVYEVINMVDAEVSGFDNSLLGKQCVSVTYEGQTTTFDVTVVEGNPITFGGNSTHENVGGLAFRFDVSTIGMATDTDNVTAIYDNATVDGYKLLGMGAIVTNGFDTRDVPAVYLCESKESSASFAVRIVNIPAIALDVSITATPYMVLEIDGVATTVYGQPQTCSYNAVIQ